MSKIFAAVVVIFFATSSQAQTPRSAEGFQERGMKRYERGDYQGAIADFTQVIELSSRLEGRRAPAPNERLAFSGGAWCAPANGLFIRGAAPDGVARPGPCAINCTNDGEFYGFHPGGAHALFADGSVRWLKEGLSVRVLAALVTYAGGEVVSGADS